MSDKKTIFTEKPTDGKPWDTAIIGSGPAGLTSAIYTTRGAVSTLIVGGEIWGGQLMLTTEVDNFPGFPDGILGPDLMNNMRKQAERFGAEFVQENVIQVDLKKDIKILKTSGGKEFAAKTVIITTGAETKWLGVPGEERLRGRGVSSCAPCDAPFFKEKDVVVVGGGDSAMEEALVLTKYAKHVTIIHRKSEFKASMAMQERVFNEVKKEKINIIWDSEIQEFKGETKLERILIKNTKKNLNQELPIDGVFVAIGHVPSTNTFKDLELDEKGYIKRNERDGYKTLTNLDGVFVAGDVHDFHYKQAITAAGFGCMAGMDVLQFLDKPVPNW